MIERFSARALSVYSSASGILFVPSNILSALKECYGDMVKNSGSKVNSGQNVKSYVCHFFTRIVIDSAALTTELRGSQYVCLSL